jgi:branched-chain amino acid transport system ATP-binding protein
VLEVANLEVVYNEVILVLRGLSIEVPDGQIIALLGSNGAGKTTTARAITGLLDVHEGKITKGSVTWNGDVLPHNNPAGIVRSGISQVMEGRRIFAELTVDENLITGAFTNRANEKQNYDRVMGLFPRLYERRSGTAGLLSGGEQQMLAIARAMMAEPELLIEQNAMMALSIANYGYIMETGKVVMDGDAKKLLADDDVKEFYLGLHAEGEKKSFKDVKHYKRRKRWAS